MTTIIHSYLRVGPLFVPVEDFRGRVVDDEYVAGAIDLSIDGQPILTRVEHDLVDQLWSYLLNLCESVANDEAGSTSFPDQPIELALSPRGRRVELTLRYPGVERRAFEERDVFFAEVACAGTVFFENLSRLIPSERDICEHELERMARLVRR